MEKKCLKQSVIIDKDDKICVLRNNECGECDIGKTAEFIICCKELKQFKNSQERMRVATQPG